MSDIIYNLKLKNLDLLTRDIVKDEFIKLKAEMEKK